MKDNFGMGRFFCHRTQAGKMVLSLHILGLAVILAAIFRTPDRILCALAMAFSSAGDYMLIDELEDSRKKHKIKNAFICGGALFIIAHILYIGTFSKLLYAVGGGLTSLNVGSYIAIGILAALIILFAVICAKKKAFSKFPLFLVYVLMLTADCYSALTYSFTAFSVRPVSVLASVGAVSFMISDLILGLGEIGGIRKFDPLLWWFYPIGQILMIIAA